MRRNAALSLGAVWIAALILAGCAATAQQRVDSGPYRYTPEGAVVWQEEYEFAPPGEEWKLVQVEEGDNEFAFAFLKVGDCPYPCQTTFAYDEEPFGYARTDLERRAREFYDRFLWASRVSFGELRTRPMRVLGGEGLVATAEATDPVKDQKVWTKSVFGRRGERVVCFYLTQWRPAGEPFDMSVEEDFDQFIESFRFLKKSFYQKL